MQRKLIAILLIVLLKAETIKINLVSTNDIHGMISSQEANFMNPQYPPTILGGSAFSKYIDQLKIDIENNTEGLILLDGGNFFQGHPLGLYDNGKTMIEWMNRIDYDAIVPGAYDFISTAQNLNNLASGSNFPFLFANLECNNCPLNSSNIKPYIIKEVEGVKVGIIGIVNSQLSELVLSENLSGSSATPEVKAIQKWVPEIKSLGAEVIIILTSSGVPWNREQEYNKFLEEIKLNNIDKNSSLNAIQMSHYLNDVDFIVAGGNSKGYPLPFYNPNSHTYVIQGYGGGTEFSHIKLLIDKESHLFKGYETVVDGRASQTLLADDFTSNQKDVKWIKEKKKIAYKKYYTDNSSKAYNTSNTKFLNHDNWEFPNLNSDNKIDVVTWNCEFFPTANDSTILALAEAVIDLDVDIIAFQEIRRTGWFSKVMDYLPEYDFVVSKSASFMDLAIIYKNNLFELKRHIEPFSENDYNYAGRPPLQIDLISKINGDEYPLTIINLHMKCCDSGLSRRKKASEMLHEYLDSIYNHQPNIIVLGDWNDDTKDDVGEHCFEPFFNDDRFFFTTQELSLDISKASYPKEPYVSFLDHIMVSNSIISIQDSYWVETIPMGEYMGGYNVYEDYISDHLPVLLSFPVTK